MIFKMKTRFLFMAILICTVSFLFSSCAVAADNTILPGATSSDSSASADSTNCYEAYLDVLKENSQLLKDQECNRTIENGKIALMDVLGDETPELLYLYIPLNNETDAYLKILTYSKAEDLTSVFDSKIYSVAGGGDNYCVYISLDDELMAYYGSNNADTMYGFWPITTMSRDDQADVQHPYFHNDSLAQLYYSSVYVEPEVVTKYKQYGKEISEEAFYDSAKKILSDIGFVLFQSADIGEYGLYEREDLWKDVTPFEEKCMNYDEAVAWLEAQGDAKEQK